MKKITLYLFIPILILLFLCICLSNKEHSINYVDFIFEQDQEQIEDYFYKNEQKFLGECFDHYLSHGVGQVIIALNYFNQDSIRKSKKDMYRITYADARMVPKECIILEGNTLNSGARMKYMQNSSENKITTTTYHLNNNELEILKNKIDEMGTTPKFDIEGDDGGYCLLEIVRGGIYTYYIHWHSDSEVYVIRDLVKSFIG